MTEFQRMHFPGYLPDQSVSESYPESEPFDADAIHAAIVREESLREEAALTAKAVEMGIPGNLKLAAYIQNLERYIDTMDYHIGERFRKLEAGDDWQR